MERVVDIFPQTVSEVSAALTPLSTPNYNNLHEDSDLTPFIIAMTSADKVYYYVQKYSQHYRKHFADTVKGALCNQGARVKPWTYADNKLKRVPDQSLKRNTDVRTGFVMGRTFLVKSAFTFGHRTVKPATGHVLQTHVAPIMFHFVRSKSPLGIQEKHFHAKREYDYSARRLQPNQTYYCASGLEYVLYTIQKTLFRVTVVPAQDEEWLAKQGWLDPRKTEAASRKRRRTSEDDSTRKKPKISYDPPQTPYVYDPQSDEEDTSSGKRSYVPPPTPYVYDPQPSSDEPSTSSGPPPTPYVYDRQPDEEQRPASDYEDISSPEPSPSTVPSDPSPFVVPPPVVLPPTSDPSPFVVPPPSTVPPLSPFVLPPASDPVPPASDLSPFVMPPPPAPLVMPDPLADFVNSVSFEDLEKATWWDEWIVSVAVPPTGGVVSPPASVEQVKFYQSLTELKHWNTHYPPPPICHGVQSKEAPLDLSMCKPIHGLPMRCPYMKSYPVDSCRHYPVDPSNRMHPMTIREWESLRDAACFWKDKYDRLYENQRRLQKINESLEEKLLHAAEKFENEKSDLTRDVSDLTSRLVEARLTIAELEEENEQYRNDCNIAVRLLQCKPSSFVAHKFNSLPADFQAKVKRHLARPAKDNRASSSLLNQCPPDVRTIKVSVPTLPSANMVYSVNKTSGGMTASTQSSTTVPSTEEITPDHVSAAIIAKVLEERSLERKAISSSKKQKTAEENRDTVSRNVAIQTDYQRPVLCRCQFVPKSRNMQSSDADGNRVPKDTIMSNSTETAI